MAATVEKPIRRRSPLSEKHRAALREAQLKRWERESTPTGMPAVRVRQELMAARRAGASFEAAWPLAVSNATGGLRSARAEWVEVLQQTRPAWERAYLRAEISACWGVLEAVRI